MRDFTLVPKDNTHENNPIYNALSHIKDIQVGMVKGMIFVVVKNNEARNEVQSFLDKNKNLFEYAK